MRVGVIGLGAMGGPMASALAAARHDVMVFDVVPAAVERAVTAGAHAAGSPAEVGAAAEVVLLSLPAPAHVAAVVAGDDGLLTNPHDGLVIVDASTVSPASSQAMAARCAERGVGFVDAPVLGRPESCGSWTFPAGGDAEAIEWARPVLMSLGTSIVHVGASGSGNALKLLNNLMFGTITTITAEVMAACDAVGIDRAVFFETVAGSAAATVSPLFRSTGQHILDPDLPPVFSVDLMAKDVALGLAMLADAGVGSDVGEAVRGVITRAQAAGLGGRDASAVVEVCGDAGRE